MVSKFKAVLAFGTLAAPFAFQAPLRAQESEQQGTMQSDTMKQDTMKQDSMKQERQDGGQEESKLKKQRCLVWSGFGKAAPLV